MNLRAVAALSLALFAGALTHAGELWSPMRLRSFSVEGGTRAVEEELRQWSAPFLKFWPSGLMQGSALREMSARLPLQFRVHWQPLKGGLKVTVASARPAVSLRWRGRTYYLSSEGLLWSHELASHYTTLLPQGLPTATLADDFPLVSPREGDEEEAMHPVTLDAGWLLSVMKKVRAQPGIVATDVMLRRRGGEDLVSCTLRLEQGGQPIRFLGRIGTLDLSLAVAKQLFLSGETKGFGLLDATYDDKVFLRPSPEGINP